MNGLRRAALGYAERGWRVFPLHGIVRGRCTCGRKDCSSPGKHPLVRRGLHEATTDLDVISRWFERWPHANVAIAMGEPSNLVAIDIDLPRAVESLLTLHKLPSTLTALTGGGGLHLIYRRVNAARCTSARLPGISRPLPGIDLRADGGYIVAPPSVHRSGVRYSWLDPDAEIAPAPTWLREARSRRPTPIAPPRFRDGTGTPYGRAVLRNQLEVLSHAQPGARNHTLNRCAFIIGRYIRSGHIKESVARAALYETALSIGLTPHEVTRTIVSAFGALR